MTMIKTFVTFFLASLMSVMAFSSYATGSGSEDVPSVEVSKEVKKDLPQEKDSVSATTAKADESTATPLTGEEEAGSAEKGLIDKAKDVYCSYVGLLFCESTQNSLADTVKEDTQSSTDSSPSKEVVEDPKN